MDDNQACSVSGLWCRRKMALKRNSDNLPENRVVVCSAETENPSAATAMPAIINSSTTNRIIILLEDMSIRSGLERLDHNVPEPHFVLMVL